MARKAETIKVSGGADYAKVAERTKIFWEENPNGKILSDHKFTEDGKLVFTTSIWRVADDPKGMANGHAMGEVKNDKDFEKFETISLGRALAKLGYLASGEIASLEEMEDFLKHREEKRRAYIQEQVEIMENAKTLEELKEAWANTNKAELEILAAKDARKVELETRSANN